MEFSEEFDKLTCPPCSKQEIWINYQRALKFALEHYNSKADA